MGKVGSSHQFNVGVGLESTLRGQSDSGSRPQSGSLYRRGLERGCCCENRPIGPLGAPETYAHVSLNATRSTDCCRGSICGWVGGVVPV